MKLQNSLIQEVLIDHIIQFTHFMYEALLSEDLRRHVEDDTVYGISWLQSSSSLPVMLKYMLIIYLFPKIIVFIHLLILIKVKKAQSLSIVVLFP